MQRLFIFHHQNLNTIFDVLPKKIGREKINRFGKDSSMKHFILISVPKFEVIHDLLFKARLLLTSRSPPYRIFLNCLPLLNPYRRHCASLNGIILAISINPETPVKDFLNWPALMDILLLPKNDLYCRWKKSNSHGWGLQFWVFSSKVSWVCPQYLPTYTVGRVNLKNLWPGSQGW